MRTIAFALLSLAAAGCGPYLRYKPMPPSPAPQGKLVIVVRDARPPGEGGKDPQVVGVRSGTFGIPDDIKVESPTTVADTVRDVVANAAEAAGLRVAKPGDESGATARVVVDVQRLWCAGWSVAYKAGVLASVQLTDPAGQQLRVPGQPVQGEDGAMKCERAFKTALTRFLHSAQTLFAQPQVHNAAIGAIVQPPPAQ